MGMRSIRMARPEDAPVLARAERSIAEQPGFLASRPDEIKDDDLRQKIVALNDHGGGVFLVAEEDGEIVGHGLLQRYKLAVTAHIAELTLAVHRGHQDRGIGKLLMHALIDWARASSRVEKIELRVRSSNQRAIALYAGLGFVEEGRLKQRIKLGPESYLDDIAMSLWLGTS